MRTKRIRTIDLPAFTVRLRQDVRTALERSAVENNRSLQSEMAERLETSVLAGLRGEIGRHLVAEARGARVSDLAQPGPSYDVGRAGINVDLLIACVESTDTELEARALKPSTRKRATLYGLVYRYCEAGGAADSSAVAKLIALME